MSSVLTPRSERTACSESPKSSPTGPTTRTSVKKVDASEKCTAEPPSIFSRSPNGVFTASNAIDPTTTRLMKAGSLANRGETAYALAARVEQRLGRHLRLDPLAEHLALYCRARR